jgi:hypothetical protein
VVDVREIQGEWAGEGAGVGEHRDIPVELAQLPPIGFAPITASRFPSAASGNLLPLCLSRIFPFRRISRVSRRIPTDPHLSMQPSLAPPDALKPSAGDHGTILPGKVQVFIR